MRTMNAKLRKITKKAHNRFVKMFRFINLYYLWRFLHILGIFILFCRCIFSSL